MDLCLSCKACKAECPTGVDMARLKAQWQDYRHRERGIPLQSHLIAALPALSAWGCRTAPLSNRLLQSGWARALLERLCGFDRRAPLPEFAPQTFRKWFKTRAQPATHREQQGRPRVVYFADTWTNYYAPQVGIAAVKVLEALGMQVIVPPTQCCGRPAISKGLLSKAKQLAEANVAVLSPYAEQDIPIVGTEPSCVSALVDEYPQLVRTPAARKIAEQSQLIESFITAAMKDRPGSLRFQSNGAKLLYHGHCHEKSLVGTAAAMELLRAATAGRAEEINSGCCGMAGAFGHEVKHYDVAKEIGEQRLFPAIRDRGEARIAAAGFSCREHIARHTGVRARHPIEYVADLLSATEEPA
jgi:Fe-S oxidoreductase